MNDDTEKHTSWLANKQAKSINANIWANAWKYKSTCCSIISFYYYVL